VPTVNPVTVIGDPEPVAVIPPELAVTVYPVIAEPPLSAGAVKVTVALALEPAVAVPIVGAPGTVFGIGKLPPDTCCKACDEVYTPCALPFLPPEVVGLVWFIRPPNQRFDIS
jgi:hypothetical protein